MKKNCKANLMIIGTQKAGTTSLFNYLKQHPDLYFSRVKELTYFVDNNCYERGEKYFNSFFSGHKNEKVIATSYVHMLPCDYCPERVKNYNPDTKFIIMVRDPIERAYSAFYYALRNGWENENENFDSVYTLEEKRLQGNLTERYDLAYFSNGLYYKHLLNWYSYFPKENFLILLDLDLYKEPENTFRRIFQFLNIDPDYKIDTAKKYNTAGATRFKALQNLMINKDSKFLRKLGNLVPLSIRIFIRSVIFSGITKYNATDQKNPPLPKDLKKKYFDYFRKDVEELSKLTARDLVSLWLR